MFVRSIEIRRENDYGFDSISPEKPLIAKIKIEGQGIETIVTVSEETSRRGLRIISEELAAAARELVEAMVADIFTIPALASPQTDAIGRPMLTDNYRAEASLPKEVDEDEIPF